jgi:16S rRNA (adenine1518-N6/adenine1519-N6)-dimethyltransferase
MSLYSQTRELLQNAGLHPRKRLGQNFLVDTRVLDAIVEAAELSPDDVILEIGAGTGALTQRLAMSSANIIAVELDKGLFRVLQSIYQDKPNVNVIHADILKLDFLTLQNLYAQNSGIKVVGNLPYYITKPILMKVLDESSRLPIQMFLAMVQREVGARMKALPGTKDYGALSVAIAYRSDVEILKRVSAASFYPKPEVDSSLVKLNIRSKPSLEVKDEWLFFYIVRAAFQYRRKTLRNALRLAGRSNKVQSKGIKLDDNTVDSALQSLMIEPKRRGETLSIAEFADLANILALNE